MSGEQREIQNQVDRALRVRVRELPLVVDAMLDDSTSQAILQPSAKEQLIARLPGDCTA
jgi:hypothetical protein